MQRGKKMKCKKCGCEIFKYRKWQHKFPHYGLSCSCQNPVPEKRGEKQMNYDLSLCQNCNTMTYTVSYKSSFKCGKCGAKK